MPVLTLQHGQSIVEHAEIKSIQTDIGKVIVTATDDKTHVPPDGQIIKAPETWDAGNTASLHITCLEPARIKVRYTNDG